MLPLARPWLPFLLAGFGPPAEPTEPLELAGLGPAAMDLLFPLRREVLGPFQVT